MDFKTAGFVFSPQDLKANARNVLCSHFYRSSKAAMARLCDHLFLSVMSDYYESLSLGTILRFHPDVLS